MFSTADIDALLKATGVVVVFSGAVPASPPIYGKLRKESHDVMTESGTLRSVTRTTLLIRDGVEPSTLRESSELTAGGVSYAVRDVGEPQPDGMRRLTIVARTS